MRAAIVLAAGLSRRFGRGDKLATRLAGRPLLHHAIDRARDSGETRVIVVVARGRMRTELPRGIERINAADRRLGIGASLAAGVRALRPIEREVLIFLGDMPLARASRRMRLTAGVDALRPSFDGIPGHPLLVRAGVVRRAMVRGDCGLAAMLDRARLRTVRGQAGAILDIDTPAKLRSERRTWMPRR